MIHQTIEELARVARVVQTVAQQPTLDDQTSATLAAWKRRLIERLEMEALAAIEALDILKGDPDLEDATDLEDDFTLANVIRFPGTYRGPGCEIADAGEEPGDQEGIDEREPEGDER